MGYRVSGVGRWYCQQFDYTGEQLGIGSVLEDGGIVSSLATRGSSGVSESVIEDGEILSSLTTRESNGVSGQCWRTVVLSVV